MSQAQRLQGLKGPTSSAAAATATTATIATVTTATTAAGLVVATQPQPHPTHGANASRPSSKSSTKKDKKEVSLLSGLPYNTALQNNLLNRCDWKNRLIYASRMLLGGNNVNGFLRGTATAQRIKKQRARQVGITKKTAASQAVLSAPESIESDKKEKKAPYHNEEEEQLKKGMLERIVVAFWNGHGLTIVFESEDIMNPRTVKKLKCELEASLSFCAQLHNLLRGIILDVDRRQKPFLPPILIVEGDQSMTVDPPVQDSAFITRPSAPPAPAPVPAPFGASSIPWTVKPVDSGASAPPKANSNKNPLPIKSTASPGNVEGSTLRKLRKTKLPPSTEPPPNLPEFDNAGRRLVNKTEHNIRLYEIMRFRALRRGDFVAARTTSRDLWILARVLKDYPSIDMAPLEFLQLTETRRDALFKDKVHVKDVEEKDGDNSFQVPRNLVLPLPRTYAEAAEWGQRIRKGMRVCRSFFVLF